MWGYSKKVSTCKPGRELSSEPDHAGILLLDFSASKIVRNNCLLFRPPRLLHFVKVAQTD